MMPDTVLKEEDIMALSRQARITLTEEEISRYTRDLNALLEMVSVLDVLEPSKEGIAAQVRLSALRDDRPSAASASPAATYRVPGVMEGV